MLMVLLGCSVVADKYTCVFDCFLFVADASAAGYVEFACDEGPAACCRWEKCVQPANSLYSSFTRDAINGPWPSRGTLTPGTICPESTSTEPGGIGGAKYSVGVSSERAAEFPRNSYPIAGDIEISCAGQSETTGCIGNCDFDALH